MTAQAREGACGFAWWNYLLLHNDISENDNRRSALYRYVTNAGNYEKELEENKATVEEQSEREQRAAQREWLGRVGSFASRRL